MHCPYCGSEDVRRTSPRWVDIFFYIFGLRPRRCRSCGRRFHRWIGEE